MNEPEKTTNQTQKRQKSGLWQAITVCGFALLLGVLPVLTLALPKQTVSEEENRTLAAAPNFSLQSYRDASFMKGVGSYLSDHFAGRTGWIWAKNSFLYATGTRELAGVFVTKSGENAGGNRLIPRGGTLNERYFQQNLMKVQDFANTFGVKPVVLLAPAPSAVYAAQLPYGSDLPDEPALFARVKQQLGSTATTVSLFETMDAHKNEEIYYRTDHHWTSLGAYLAYAQLAPSLGLTPHPQSSYQKIEAATDFLGTSQSKCLIVPNVKADRVEFWEHPAVGDQVRVTDGEDTLLSESPFFSENIGKKDKYTCFLGENRAVTILENKAAPDQGLLIFKDSYANALVPFLTAHYREIVLVDLRYYRGDITKLCKISDFDHVIFCYGMDAFISQNQLGKLVY